MAEVIGLPTCFVFMRVLSTSGVKEEGKVKSFSKFRLALVQQPRLNFSIFFVEVHGEITAR